MNSKSAYFRSVNFWIISFISVVSFTYLLFCEIFPTDWFLSSKSFNNNEKFIYKKTFSRHVIADKSISHLPITKYTENPEVLLEKVEYVYKDRKLKTSVVLVTLEGKRYIVKKYAIPNFRVWIKNAPICSSKGYRSWHYAYELLDLGISTAKPLLFIEKKVGPFWGSSYLIYEYLDGLPAIEYFKANSPFEKNWELAMRNLEALLHEMNDNLIINGDFSLNNMVYIGVKPYLIDLDCIHHYRLEHAFYRGRYKSQHIKKLNRKFGEINLEAQKLFQRHLNFQDTL